VATVVGKDFESVSQLQCSRKSSRFQPMKPHQKITSYRIVPAELILLFMALSISQLLNASRYFQLIGKGPIAGQRDSALCGGASSWHGIQSSGRSPLGAIFTSLGSN
jgi:hypothetical protein